MGVLPYYLAIGMPYNLFWHGEPILAKVYREAHDLRNTQKNQEMWIQGIYNYKAFRSVIEAFAYGLSGGKGSRPSEYPKEPLALTETDQKIAAERSKARTMEWVDNGQH